MSRRFRWWVVAAVTAGCLAAPAACGSGPAPSPSTPTSEAASSVAPTTASPTPAGPPALTGETSPIHDPALIVADGTWYVFSTGRVQRENGGTIQISTSPDGVVWSAAGTVWDKIPGWIDQRFAGGVLPDNLWAPEIYEHDGTFYLYYSASRFGTDDSVTALATNTTLDPKDPDYRWKDEGPVMSSPVADLERDDPSLTFNAIDAGIIEDSKGRPFMTIGSFWSGIFLVPLDWPSGKPVKGWKAKTVHLAQRQVEGDPIEAAYTVRHQDYFYLFVSFDLCCRGADSTYKIAVGRSTSLQGPYVDREGTKLLEGGGTVLLESEGTTVGPGGQSVFDDTLAFHYYDGGNETSPNIPTLGLRTLTWTGGWPSVG